ncbi:unnamed protein product [Macrosiphum euphorbiae]|uniref:Uncharacterized protein n=1 Tax=Macrosiphum euphorbiae TaxID=13131 RepID=A0AAV0WGR1_9HEMI|nr:unnamed protein product [Macrosiphum euphorbiae]
MAKVPVTLRGSVRRVSDMAPAWRAATMVQQCLQSELRSDYSVTSMPWNYIRIYLKRKPQKKKTFRPSVVDDAFSSRQ